MGAGVSRYDMIISPAPGVPNGLISLDVARMEAGVNCKNCGKQIVQTNWYNGPGWNHASGGPVCGHLRAEPEAPPWAGRPENPCSSSTCPIGDDCTDSCMVREVAFVEAGRP